MQRRFRLLAPFCFLKLAYVLTNLLGEDLLDHPRQTMFLGKLCRNGTGRFPCVQHNRIPCISAQLDVKLAQGLSSLDKVFTFVDVG